MRKETELYHFCHPMTFVTANTYLPMITRNPSSSRAPQSESFEQHLQEIVFIDRGVDDYQFLAQGVKPGAEVHVLGANAVAQMTAVLAQSPHVKAVHVVSHGAPGCLYLGESELSLSTLEQHEAQLQAWFADYAGAAKPELLLYGCNVAAGDAGEEFLRKLARLTGVIPQASRAKVGSPKAGAAWQFENGVEQTNAVNLFSVETQLNYSAAFAPGDLDTSFGTGGKVTTDISGGSDEAWSIATDAAGNILAAGYANTGSNNDFALVRYDSSGQLDSNFGTSGKVTTDFSNSDDRSYSIAIDGSNNILIGGFAGSDFAIARYTNTGQLDNSFGTGGKVTTDFNGGGDQIWGITTDASNNIVVAGLSGNDFALARYTSAGLLDTNFGSSGKVTTDFNSSNDRGLSLTLDGSGNILVAGSTTDSGTGQDFAIARYTSSGILDTNFGTGGKVTTDFSGSTDEAHSITTDASGNILVAGYSNSTGGSNFDFAISRYTSNGQLDSSFGTNGKVVTALNNNYEQSWGITTDAAGNILVAGNANNGGSTNNDFVVVRYDSSGQLDNTFGNSGVVNTDFSLTGISEDYGRSIALDANGDILVAGSARNGNTSNDFAVIRLDGSSNALPTGTVAISGNVAEDSELIADTTSVADADGLGNFSYQWQVQEGGEGDFSNIVGANSASFTPGDDEVGDALQVVVSYTDNGGTQESVTSSSTGLVANVNDEPIVDVQIATQNAQEASPFSFVIPANAFSDVDDASFTYTALLNEGGEGIPGDGTRPLPQDYWLSFDGTTLTGTPDDADVGNITLEVTATDSGNLSATQLFTLSVANTNELPTGGVTLPSSATEDQLLTADTTTLADTDGIPANGLSYQWQSQEGGEGDFVDIVNATAENFTPGDAEVGDKLRVVVSYTDNRGTQESVTSDATAAVNNVNDPPSGTFVLEGNPATEGNALSVSLQTVNSSLNDADGITTASPTFQWQESTDGTIFSDIANETGISFTPDDAQVGKQLRLKVSYTDDQGTDEVLYSDPTAATVNTNDAPTGSVTVDGTPTEEQSLTANTTALSDADGIPANGLSYQWQYFFDEGGETGYSNIAGATEVSFTPDDAQVNQQLRVVVSYTDDQGMAEMVASADTSAIASVNDEPTLSGPTTIDVAEDAAPGTVLATFATADADGPAPTLSISGGNDAGLFVINGAGEVSLAPNAELDFESGTTSYNLTITATEGASALTPLSTDASLSINVTDVIESVDPAFIAWNPQTGGVSSLTIDAVNATASLVSTGRSITDTNWALQTVGDMDGDGQNDILLRHATAGQNLAWYMNPGGQSIKSEALIGRDVPDANWSIVGTGDMNGDGNADIVLRNPVADQIVAWYMDGSGNILSESLVGRSFGDNNWKIEAMADFNQDGKADILLRNAFAGQNVLWEMDGANIIGESLFGRNVPDTSWQIEGASDFDGNGTIDVLMRHLGAGQVLLWSMADKNTIASERLIANVPDGTSQIVF